MITFLCCDWCINIFSFGKKSKSQKKFYLPSLSDDLDEKELTEEQSTSLSDEYIIMDKQKQAKTLNTQLKVETNLENPTPDDEKHSESSKSQNDPINDFDQKNNQERNQQTEQITKQKLQPDYTKFSINLDPYDKYYKLFHEKTDKLEQYFNQKGNLIQLGQTKCQLKVKKLNGFKFQARYQLPCSYSFYSMLMKDGNPSNKKYLSYFQVHQVLQAFKPNLSRNLTRLKRFNMLQPREFVYLKYSNGSSHQNWQICINDSEQDLLSQQKNSCKRGQIFAIGNFKQLNNKLYIYQFIEIDLKLNNLNIWNKIIYQFKQYIQKLYSYIQTYYQKQLL